MRNIALFLCLCFTCCCVAAQPHDSPLLTFGKYRSMLNSGQWSGQPASIAEIIANPALIFSVSGYTVLGFSFSIRPARSVYIGPYAVKGSELTPALVEIIRKHAGNSGEIYIEDIKVIGPDKNERTAAVIGLKYGP